MTLYTTDNCPQCKFLKQKLTDNGFTYEICKDVDIMASKQIKNVPMLELNDGTLLSFSEAMRQLDKGTLYDCR